MTARKWTLSALAATLGAAVVLLFLGVPQKAAAQCCAPPAPPPTPCCSAPPTPCCAPPTPPPVPPSTPCCTPGHNVYVPGVNVFVAPTVVVNAQVNASASASAGAVAGAGAFGQSGAIYYGGGGGGGGIMPPQATGVIQGLAVEGSRRERKGYEATRSRTMRVVIRAVCIDDREVPHPASQVTPDRDIDQAFEGELYRCIAGTRMQWTATEFNGQVTCFTSSRDGFGGGDVDRSCLIGAGQTTNCAKGEALYHSADGTLACRPQRPARDCNERSLLRRFGAGIKVLTWTMTERYTEYREEEVRESASSAGSLTLDGGVGGTAY